MCKYNDRNLQIIQLVGLSAMGVGIWQVVLDNVTEVVFSDVNGKIIGGLFIGSGGGLAIVSIFGVVGACFKSRFTLLTVKFVCSLVVLVLLLTALCSTP